METIHSLNELTPLLNEDFIIVLAKTHACSLCALTEKQLGAAIPQFEQFRRVQIYIDDHDAFRGALEVFTVPTVMIFAHGKELLRESRFINVEKIKRLLTHYQD